MGERSDRETCALEALIVSRLRVACDDETNPGKFPALTAADQDSLQCLKPDFIDKLLERSDAPVELPQVPEHSTTQTEQPIGGLCRAEEYEGESADEVALNRLEIRRKLKEERDGRPDQSGS